MGHSLMTQFEGLEFRPVTLPFVSSVDKALEAVRRINRAAEEEGIRPIIFSTLVQDDLRDIVMTAHGLFLDFFAAFVGPLERELNTRSTHRAGRAHGMADIAAYTARINATNYALSNDDGTGGDYAHADVILVGVSRSGKTPTCLYMALQQVQYELRGAEALFMRYAIPCLDTTECSIEEIASRILNTSGIERRLRP